ncbi:MULTISPECIES: DMT family transporter [Rhizobium]|uniref:DMT family transporter n=1 Tax=Rhizobium tropici TaxID=398 RepID=A0A6P1C4I1_RHITR|nr:MULTISPECIES: DMT family transporter [Rhizobium]AGB69862.1 drug/metabolite exporter (DME) family transporter [Rhizobium tropici CIAT 899]MBB4239746.1 drug/metabolite transporter (DMT)-like permease [Rhizobium tropici]MBB5591016.1 drug/metabolite transporter (DMT)-like permease [Rhizobium tropici]MBB6489775.1 drug/metabolite transporter (DMT)-like permease [Rhizobium tropici]NEV12099.1 DMT family transporter [Rhizobium tropici]
MLQKSMGAVEWSMLVGLSILWGGSFLFNGILVRELPPFTIVTARVALAAIALHVIVRATGHAMPKDRQTWLAFFGMGFLNNVIPFLLIVWGQTHIASGLASILNATTPLFAVVVAHFLTEDEKMTGNRLIGVIVGFAGVALMIGPSVLASLGSNVLAQLAVLGAAFSYSLAGIFGRRFRRMGLAPIIPAAGQVTGSAIMLLPIALFVDRPWTLAMPSTETWLALAGLAILSTAIAYVLFFRILATAGATNLMLVTFLIPVSAILLGALVLGESLQSKHFIGMALIAVGLAAIDGRLFIRSLRGRVGT